MIKSNNRHHHIIWLFVLCNIEVLFAHFSLDMPTTSLPLTLNVSISLNDPLPALDFPFPLFMNPDFRTDRLREDLTTLVDNKDYSSPYDATFYRKDESNKGNDWLKDKTSAIAQFSQNVDDFPALHGEVSTLKQFQSAWMLGIGFAPSIRNVALS